MAIRKAIIVLAAVFAGLALSQVAGAQDAPADRWNTQCVAPDSASPLACTVEQRIILKDSGQQIARFAVQMSGPADKRVSGYLVQLPLGLSLRNGILLKVDENEPVKLDLQTCEASGCYGGDTLKPEFLESLSSGKILTVTFANLQQKEIGVQIDLAGFSAAFAKIK